MKIRVKYCGGCNPEIDRVQVVEKLFSLLDAKNTECRFAGNSDDPDLVLVVNGCAHACKEEELRASPAPWPLISVQGKSIDLVAIAEDRLPCVLFDQIHLHMGIGAK